MLNTILIYLARALLALRYRVRVKGLDKIQVAGERGALLLCTHPALIDPIILLSRLYPHFKCRILADEDQVIATGMSRLADMFGVIRLPDAVKHGKEALDGVSKALRECGRVLENGENVMIYPAGHILRSREEDIGGNSGVATILAAAPDSRVVLVRIRGLWGSSFSRASGSYPDLGGVLRRAVRQILVNGIFFMPRRKVEIEVWEPENFPENEDRRTVNAWLEKKFNENAPANTYVPYYFWERGGVRVLPEPATRRGGTDLAAITPTVRKLVTDKLADLCGRTDFDPAQRLANDLGMDSLTRVELVIWVEKEFGFSVPNPDMFETVEDVFAAASGQALADSVARLEPAPNRWFVAGRSAGDDAPRLPEGDNIAAMFLAQAARRPGAAVLADQTGGVRSYRDIITALLVMKPMMEKMPGERIGIMLPASATAAIVYLAVLFAGKTPVMINWTLGERNINYLVELMKLQTILTAGKLTGKLKSQGASFGRAEQAFVYLDKLAPDIPLSVKLRAKLTSYFSWRALDPRVCDDTAVVLFTSGSESLPKAVPLTHANILANIRDISGINALRASDAMIAFLPPFHSFGLTLTLILPLITGVRAVYHPNPTEGGTLAKLIGHYRATILPGTPTFLNGILKSALPSDLATLRLGVTGAEKCPEHVYNGLKEICPDMTILEGYGITECSPVVSVNRPENPVPFSIGRIMPALEYLILDDDGQVCPSGKQGMLLVRGPSVFSGYLEYDGPSPFVEHDGREYYRTGDLVVEDENGILFFKGRLKRFVKLGGEMISLPAIEEVLLQHFSSPDDEGPVLAVEALNEDAPEITLFTTGDIERTTANEVIRKAGLSALHNIRRIEKVESIPLLGTGKTDYRALKKDRG